MTPDSPTAEHLAVLLYLFRIPELMRELRRAFPHRDYIVVMVAMGGLRP